MPAAGLWSQGVAFLQATQVTQLQRICGVLRAVLMTPLSPLRYTGINYSRHWNNSSSPFGGVLFVLVFLTSQTIYSLTEHRLFQEQQSRVRLNFSVIKKTTNFSDFFFNIIKGERKATSPFPHLLQILFKKTRPIQATEYTHNEYYFS